MYFDYISLSSKEILTTDTMFVLTLPVFRNTCSHDSYLFIIFKNGLSRPIRVLSMSDSHWIFHLIQGVMMTHANVLATVSAVMTIVPDIGSKDIYMAYLPMAHILELAAEVCWICKLVLLVQ